jgi:glutamyl-tRNA reductase
VDKTVTGLQHITLIDVDSLSRMKDETLQKRAAEVPKAQVIIAGHMRELLDWHEMRKHVPVLREVKSKLQEIYSSPLFEQAPSLQTPAGTADQKIQRVLNGMASKMRVENQRGCQYIQAINEFIAAG